jgi:hypothetical protein
MNSLSCPPESCRVCAHTSVLYSRLIDVLLIPSGFLHVVNRPQPLGELSSDPCLSIFPPLSNSRIFPQSLISSAGQIFLFMLHLVPLPSTSTSHTTTSVWRPHYHSRYHGRLASQFPHLHHRMLSPAIKSTSPNLRSNSSYLPLQRFLNLPQTRMILGQNHRLLEKICWRIIIR